MEKKVGSAIKAAIVERGRTITDVADAIGISYDQLSNICNGRTKLNAQVAEDLRLALAMPRGWPFDQLVELRGVDLVPIQVIGVASAGNGETARDMSNEPVYVPANMTGERRVGLVVDGLSIYPHLQPGDVAVFEQYPFPRNNLVYLFMDPEGAPCVKQLLVSKGQLMTHAFNPEVPDASFPVHARLVGYLVGLYRASGSREMILVDSSGIRFDDFS